MKALTFQAVNRLEFCDVPDAKIIEPTDALIRVTYCGVCGSDLHVLEGRESGIDPGTIFGHEFSGEVVEVGHAVSGFAIGDRVCGPFTTNCGSCEECGCGLTARCRSGHLFGWVSGGAGLQGTHAELLRVPFADATLFRLPESVAVEDGVLLGDNLATAFYCAERAEVRSGQPVVVLGCGTVGVLTIKAAGFLGADEIYAVDSIPWRRQRATEAGATAVFSIEAAYDEIMQRTARGAAAVLEAVGSPANALAFQLVRPGGCISSVGVPTAEHFAFSPVAAYDKNITLTIGRCPARAYMDRIARLLQDKAIELSSHYTHRLPLASGAEAYRMFAGRDEGVGKILLQP